MSDSASSDRTVPTLEPSEKLAEADPSQAAMIPIGEEALQESEELAEAEVVLQKRGRKKWNVSSPLQFS